MVSCQVHELYIHKVFAFIDIQILFARSLISRERHFESINLKTDLIIINDKAIFWIFSFTGNRADTMFNKATETYVTLLNFHHRIKNIRPLDTSVVRECLRRKLHWLSTLQLRYNNVPYIENRSLIFKSYPLLNESLKAPCICCHISPKYRKNIWAIECFPIIFCFVDRMLTDACNRCCIYISNHS